MSDVLFEFNWSTDGNNDFTSIKIWYCGEMLQIVTHDPYDLKVLLILYLKQPIRLFFLNKTHVNFTQLEKSRYCPIEPGSQSIWFWNWNRLLDNDRVVHWTLPRLTVFCIISILEIDVSVIKSNVTLSNYIFYERMH